jgi:hypothetical protein
MLITKKFLVGTIWSYGEASWAVGRCNDGILGYAVMSEVDADEGIRLPFSCAKC